MNNDDDNKYNKYAIGVAIYLALCFGLYELKKERSIPITHEEVLLGVKKGQITLLTVVRQDYDEKEDSDNDSKGKIKASKMTARKIYLTIDGIQYVSYVPEIGIFYDRINQI